MISSCSPFLYDFFLAHAGPDANTAADLYRELITTNSAFVDVVSLKGGEDWDLEIAKAQRASRVTVVLVSSATEKAYYARTEIATGIALARENADSHRVVPVYLDEMRPSAGWDLYGLSLKHGFQVTNVGGTKEVADRLRRMLDTSGSSLPPPLAQPLHAYPVGPLVPLHLIDSSIITAYAATFTVEEAPLILAKAASLRIAADPRDPRLTYVAPYDVPAPTYIAPRTYWQNVFAEAGRHGPRMLAALLLSVDDWQFKAQAKQDRSALLQKLREYREDM
jgi:TIR domain